MVETTEGVRKVTSNRYWKKICNVYVFWYSCCVECEDEGASVMPWLHVQFIACNALQLFHAITAGFQTCSKIFTRPKCCSQWQRLVESRDNNSNSSSDDISDMTSPVTH